MSAKVKLTTRYADKLEPAEKPYEVRDKELKGLLLRVQPSGVKSYVVTWGRGKRRTLGQHPVITAEGARTQALAALSESAQHGAPLAVIEANKPASEKPITLGDFVRDHFTPWAKVNQKAWQATIDALEACFGHLYERDLRSLSHTEFDQFKIDRVADKIKKSTVNRDLSRIRKVFTYAVEREFLTAHPMVKVKQFKGGEADNKRVRYLGQHDEGEEARLHKALAAREAERRASRERHNAWHAQRGSVGHPQWPDDGYTDHVMPIVLVALHTGMRRGELFSLEWSHINWRLKQVSVTWGNTKSSKTRHVPLNANAVDVLARWKKQGNGAGLVFPSPKTGGKLDNVDSSWAEIVDTAKLVDFHFHDLRHDFASKLVMAGVNLYVVKELLGHAKIEMTMRYAHLAPDHLADAVAKLEAKK